jgi:L-fuculose-phosphate aldolase
MEYGELRHQTVRAAEHLFATGVMSHSGHGNLSARLPGAERMLLTPGGIIRGLDPARLCVVDFDGNVLDGELEAVAREIVAMHAAVYRERATAGAAIHTHSPHVTTFAVAGRPLPCVYEAMLRFGVADDVPVADWGPRGSPESVRAIAATLRAHPRAPAVLLANHGLLASGADPLAAAQLVVTLEEAAELSLAAQGLGGARPFPAGALEREREHMARFAG